jgi:hypothetical protein
MLLSIFLKTLVLQSLSEGSLASRLEVFLLAPSLPRREQHRAEFEAEDARVLIDAILEPLAEVVLILKIFVGRLAHAGRGRESDPLPFEAPVDAPAQDCLALGPQFLGQLAVALVDRDFHHERNHEHSPLHGFVDRAEARFVIAGNEQFKRRGEVEKILPHETGGELVAAGQTFDFYFIPASALLGFLCNNETCPAELGDIARVSFVVGDKKGVHISDGGVVAKDLGQRIDKRAFAVCALAVSKYENVFVDEAGATIADVALQEFFAARHPRR